MTRRFTWTLCLIFLLSAPLHVSAQEAGAVGVVATTSPAIGLVWNASERLALRPEISFNAATIENESLDDSASHSSSFNAGASLLVTLRRWTDLSIYVAPRLTVSRTSTESESVSPLTRVRFETTTTGFGLGGSFGAQYMLGDRFSVFGETGLNFSRLTSESEPVSVIQIADRTTTSVGTRSAVGVVFYF